ncbi:MAG: hypothetical protein O2960_27880 [Verrucomicrobia bacterium]|nr:hypothetical protein [Verrucomicrobiota bacterium]
MEHQKRRDAARTFSERKSSFVQNFRAVPLLVWLCIPAGCVSTSDKRSALELEDPKANRGALTEDAHSGGVIEMAKRIDTIEADQAGAVPEKKLNSDQSELFKQPQAAEPIAPQGEAENVLIETADAELPDEASKLIVLPKLSSTELSEMLSGIGLKLQAEHGYKSAAASDIRMMPSLLDGVSPGPVYSKKVESGKAILRFGHKRFLSQPAQFLVQGVMFDSDGEVTGANSDLDKVASMIEESVKSVADFKQNLGGEDLAFRIIQLSYIDTAGALIALKGFGIHSSADLWEVDLPIEFGDLPWVAPMPAPTSEQTGLLGAEREMEKGAFDLSVTPSVATPLPTDVNMAPASQLLVYYHPAHPEQFSRVKQLLAEFIDRPTRQIFVEGMVLEISEEGLSELGVEWQFREGNFETVVGSVAPAGTAPNTVNFDFDNAWDISRNWAVQLKALVREGKAEVLSRPSVLTLNNRQATIRVGTDIPIATSEQDNGFSSSGQIAFNFKYLATGISLNVMPRANEAGNEVSLLIDTIVSSVVPGAELALRSSSGEVLASAPTVATRRIQTYARINNNTPFIIGGLVNKELTTTRDKVPLLGDIPYLGVFFRSEKISSKKREVIIVLTPHVLASAEPDAPGRFLPKDEDRFDEFGNALFRDTFRIRSEDIFDLTFLTENQRLQRYRELAMKAISRDFRLAYREPFRQFANGRIPGEEILVRRMIYEVIKRLAADKSASKNWLDSQVNPARMIVFESQQIGGYNVQFLDRMLSKLGDGDNVDAFFAKNPRKALAIEFHLDSRLVEPGNLATTPIPKIRLIDCDGEKEWSRLLWDSNQPDENGNPRYSIVLHNRSDLVRLQRAIMLKKIVGLNGGESNMALSNFSLGKVLLMPEAKSDQTHLIDSEIAKLFFQSENYYGAAIQTIEDSLSGMDKALKRPEYNWIQ